MIRHAQLLHWCHPVRLIQGLVVAANTRPMLPWLHAIYALGLRVLIRQLSRYREIHAIYGCGSFFDGAPLYGHSDIDLVIVFKASVERNQGVQFSIARSYKRLRLIFPFLGRWSEKSANLIFLSEITAGFPIPAAFRVRMREQRFTRVYGDDWPILIEGQPTVGEYLEEVDTLLRTALLTHARLTARKIFWQRLFQKLLGLMVKLSLPALAELSQGRLDFHFSDESSRRIYFRACDPDDYFPEFLRLIERIHASLRARERAIDVTPTEAEIDPAPVPMPVPAFMDESLISEIKALPSIPLGFGPELFYASLDDSLSFARLRRQSYSAVRQFIGIMHRAAKHRDTVLVQLGQTLLLITEQGDYVDLIPLNPIVHARAYALRDGSLECAVPESILPELLHSAEQHFKALQRAYAKHTGWLPSSGLPEIFLEDDIDTIRDAFDNLRAFLACPPRRRLLGGSESVAHYLIKTHPETESLLTLILEYYAILKSGARGSAPANNLYRCLHQLVAQILAGADTVETDDPFQQLGLSVGIVTRNRAQHLTAALDSLTRQSRLPDEIIIVDNGSTDATRSVIDSFRQRLPIQYSYLAEASIPSARNQVLALANHEVVAFTDDDCSIPNGWLSSIERAFLRADNIGLVGGWVAHWPAEQATAVDRYYEIFHGHKT